MSNFWKRGDPLIWVSALCLLILVFMITGMLWIILTKGLGFFWPKEIVQLDLKDGREVIGELHGREEIPHLATSGQHRIQLKVGNRDVYGQDFRWIAEADIRNRTQPKGLVCVERLEYGNMYGRVAQLHRPSSDTTANPSAEAVQEAVGLAQHLRQRVEVLELAVSRAQAPAPDMEAELENLREQHKAHHLTMLLASGTEVELETSQIVRIIWPNDASWFSKLGAYVSRFWEFLTAEPREANMEGGIFPAIFGTVMMVMIMTIVVVPLGVLVAIYLHEYAKEGLFVRLVRIAMNNLAGVPSIVFGMFGLGFFIYFVGGGIDQLFFSDRLPSPTFGTSGILWASLTLALLTLPVVVVSTEEALSAVPIANREGALALAATKLQMLWHVVIPNAMPGILTGLILAVSRGAGEVAPLMITGAVKLAPDLPVDATWPFLHLERKFMHLGFHIFDVGFQSPNVEAAKPMVYTTTLLLILLVLGLNLAAMMIRNRLRKRYRSAAL